jgi:hypothetical protein
LRSCAGSNFMVMSPAPRAKTGPDQRVRPRLEASPGCLWDRVRDANLGQTAQNPLPKRSDKDVPGGRGLGVVLLTDIRCATSKQSNQSKHARGPAAGNVGRRRLAHAVAAVRLRIGISELHRPETNLQRLEPRLNSCGKLLQAVIGIHGARARTLPAGL